MPETHARRRDLLRAAIATLGADAALITRLVNIRYLTGLASSHAALLVPAAGEAVLATDSRYAGTARRVCPDVELLAVASVEPALAGRAASQGWRRLAFEAHEMTVERHRALTEAALDTMPLGRAVEELRMVKDDEEIALLAQACAITGEALDQVVPAIRPGMTERELAIRLERAMVDAGAEAPGFETIVASGPNGAIPHHSPSGRAFLPGDMVTIDCGACCGGYHADLTRTVVIGEAAAWQRELHALAVAAQLAGFAAAVPGAPVAAVDAAAREVIEAGGKGGYFTHGVGHGVGLEIHEAPMLLPDGPGTLTDRVPITVEPGIYLPGEGGVRVEDTLVVRSGPTPGVSPDLLTTTRTVPRGELLVL